MCRCFELLSQRVFCQHHHVHVQAADLSLMLRKSVEARDWLSAVEPRSVRAVMKRVVEDVTLVDAQVEAGIVTIKVQSQFDKRAIIA